MPDGKKNRMKQILDCLVNYFGLEEDGQPASRRYYCYHLLAGPGPTAGAGVAAITTLALHDAAERCNSCQHFHLVETGGPAAAIAAAIHYLDAYHARDHVRKMQSAIRGLDDNPLTQTAERHVEPEHFAKGAAYDSNF
jgi:hypothetical protein